MSKAREARAFTVIELTLVLLILGLASTLLIPRFGTLSYWQDEAFLRRLNETIVFLHHQAIADESFYRLDLFPDHYVVRVMASGGDVHDSYLTELAMDAGNLSLELAAFLNPSVGRTFNLIPPPSFPSMAEPVFLPAGSSIESVRTMRGRKEIGPGESSYISFSPRGFSEFAVINIRLSSGQDVTVLVNPFTGNSRIFREKLDFEWAYGRS